MAARYTKKIPEFVYFIGEDSHEWKEGPFVNPPRGNRKYRKFKLIEVKE